MSQSILVERFFEALVNGDRLAARAIVSEASVPGVTARDLINNLFWPAYDMVEKLYRHDQITRVSYQFATRVLRALVHQTAGKLEMEPKRSRSILCFSGPTDGEELGAQMAVDLLEASGFNVRFAGGNIAADEILAMVHELRPDVLLLFASGPSDLPGVRSLIGSLKDINACPTTRIAVGGGVFNRAEGLADEIGIDLYAPSPMEMVELMIENPEPVTMPAAKKVVRRRRAAA